MLENRLLKGLSLIQKSKDSLKKRGVKKYLRFTGTSSYMKKTCSTSSGNSSNSLESRRPFLETGMHFNSRRSPFYSRHGMVSCSQTLASEIGLSILKEGGNSVDAAIGIAAALNVTEPGSTGLGGDCFLLYYDAKTRKVHGLNGSGFSPVGLDLETAKKESAIPNSTTGDLEIDSYHANSVTVPGTIHAWMNAVETFGSKRFTLAQLLEPAAKLADEGWPVSDITSIAWRKGRSLLIRDGKNNSHELLMRNLEAPLPGEIMCNPTLAATLREIGEYSQLGLKEGYQQIMEGRIGDAIIEAVTKYGGHLVKDDLLSFESEIVDPLHVSYCGKNIYEIPPNGQGLTALLAFNFLKVLENEYHISFGNNDGENKLNSEVRNIEQGSEEYFHILIEALRLAFADARYYITDSRHNNIPIAELLSETYASSRIKSSFNIDTANANIEKGSPTNTCDTVSFQTVDKDGNAVSFVNSTYKQFGSGIIPKGCGFTLQNRGNNFSLDPSHPNCLEPRKRPYHTIIPCMVTHADTEDLYCSLTNMGGFMQPQGHVQLLLSLLRYKLNPQEAIDRPRFCIQDGNCNGMVELEDGIPEAVIQGLVSRGHKIKPRQPEEKNTYEAHDVFGRAQIIFRNRETGVLIGGSDGRIDGCAMGY